MRQVNWYDEDGNLKKSWLPKGAPDEDAPLGIPAGLSLGILYPEPFATQLEKALAARGIIDEAAVDQPGASTLIRQSIQQILKIETNRIKQHIKGNNQ